jgi:hypothetical protein
MMIDVRSSSIIWVDGRERAAEIVGRCRPIALDVTQLDQVAAAGSKPGLVGDGAVPRRTI